MVIFAVWEFNGRTENEEQLPMCHCEFFWRSDLVLLSFNPQREDRKKQEEMMVQGTESNDIRVYFCVDMHWSHGDLFVLASHSANNGLKCAPSKNHFIRLGWDTSRENDYLM